jgi:hypothetical protein
LTGWEKQKELARYRVQQAEESLDEVRYLLAGGSFRKNGGGAPCGGRSNMKASNSAPFACPMTERKLVRCPRNSP